MSGSSASMHWSVLETGMFGQSCLFNISAESLAPLLPLLTVGTTELEDTDTKFHIRRINKGGAVFQTASLRGEFRTTCVVSWDTQRSHVYWRAAIRMQMLHQPISSETLKRLRQSPLSTPWMAIAEAPPDQKIQALPAMQPSLELAMGWAFVARFMSADAPHRKTVERYLRSTTRTIA